MRGGGLSFCWAPQTAPEFLYVSFTTIQRFTRTLCGPRSRNPNNGIVLGKKVGRCSCRKGTYSCICTFYAAVDGAFYQQYRVWVTSAARRLGFQNVPATALPRIRMQL